MSILSGALKSAAIFGTTIAGVAYADEIGDGIMSLTGAEAGSDHWAAKVDEVLNNISSYTVSAGDKILGDHTIGSLSEEHSNKLMSIITATVGGAGFGAIFGGVHDNVAKPEQGAPQFAGQPRDPNGHGRA